MLGNGAPQLQPCRMDLQLQHHGVCPSSHLLLAPSRPTEHPPPPEREQGLDPSRPTQHLLVPHPGTPHCSEQQDLGWEPFKELMWGGQGYQQWFPPLCPTA